MPFSSMRLWLGPVLVAQVILQSCKALKISIRVQRIKALQHPFFSQLILEQYLVLRLGYLCDTSHCGTACLGYEKVQEDMH